MRLNSNNASHTLTSASNPRSCGQHPCQSGRGFSGKNNLEATLDGSLSRFAPVMGTMVPTSATPAYPAATIAGGSMPKASCGVASGRTAGRDRHFADGLGMATQNPIPGNHCGGTSVRVIPPNDKDGSTPQCVSLSLMTVESLGPSAERLRTVQARSIRAVSFSPREDFMPTAEPKRETVMGMSEIARRALQLANALTKSNKPCRLSKQTPCEKVYASPSEYCLSCRVLFHDYALSGCLSQMVKEDRNSRIEMERP